MNIRHAFMVTSVTGFLALPLSAQTATNGRARTVADEVRTLSADAWGGRRTCAPGNDSAAAWLAERLRRTRIQPAGDSGGYLQRWVTGNTTATRSAGVADCRTQNVIGTLPGRGAPAGRVIIIGAHFDHLGTGRFGSASGDSGVIHNGADDNASGTAALLEMARLLARDRQQRDARPRHTIVLAFWSGEEFGLLGSAWFTERLPMPRESVTAYINFDMVGRMREGRLMALGAESAREWRALVDSANAGVGLDIRASGDGWGPSDHASFTARRIPVLHLFTDLHEDYHRPSDDAERINADGIVQAADFATNLVKLLDRGPVTQLTFVDLPRPQPQAAAGTGRARPSLGTIPDMASEPGGVRLSGVRAGSVADSAGLREGDVLVGIGTHTIANLQDFQDALMSHAAGDRVEIRYRRGDRVVAVMVTLGGRAN